MKIKLILTILAFGAASFSFAQSENAMSSEEIKQQAMELTEQMTSELDLNETQVERMKGLNMSMMKKKAEMQNMNLTEAQMAEKMKAYEERQNATAKEVLSDEQYKKYVEKYSTDQMTKKKNSKNK